MLLNLGAGASAGLGSPPKGLLFGVSDSVGLTLLKKLGVEAVGSLGASWVCPKLNFGALAAGSAGLDASCVWPKPNFGVLSVVVSAGFGVSCVCPKLNFGADSCAFGASCVCPKLNLEVLDSVGFAKFEKRLLAGAGVAAPPNMFVAGAGTAGSAGFGVAVAPKLKRPVEAGAGLFSSF